MTRRLLPLLLAAACFPALTPPASSRPPVLLPCHVPGVREEVRCGNVFVWENRDHPARRRLALRIVALPSRAPTPARDPVFVLAGGPGAAATALAPSYARAQALRARHDIVLVDQRGTGASNPLRCHLFGLDALAGREAALLGDALPPAAVERCRQRLEGQADLSQYSTARAADDLDEVRSALGYQRIDLLGGSYGTLVAQVYLRRHPDAVRAVVLDGVVPLDEPLPLHHAAAGDRALKLLLAECAKDPLCHAAYPRLPEELDQLFATLDRRPEVHVQTRGKTLAVTPSRPLIAEALRLMLYGDDAADVPFLIDKASRGDLGPLVERALRSRLDIESHLALGANLAVLCSEDLPFIDDAAAARETAGTLLGDARIRELRAACAVWPHVDLTPAERAPVVSRVPTLLLSGERDPVTPPEFGARVASHLPDSRQLVLPHGGHGARGDCVSDLVADFLERASARGLRSGCLAETPPTRFKVPGEPPRGAGLR
jgi:pimeloyl-ACP methyl ester carboxylesterase